MASVAHSLPRGISIGDVAKICGVQASTIRFWEKEFARFLAPLRTSGGQRRYRDADVARIMEIKKLLWVDRFTIEGAKKLLGGEFAFAYSPKGLESVALPQMELQGAA